MSGQETNFGQMECLKLISNNSLIEKRIGYLGLTQLFHEKSELLMMATNRIRIDLSSNNNNIVGLVLCVLSEICTSELARDLHQDVLKCIGNNSAYIRKKAILTSIKIVKRVPEYITEFLPKISTCL
jgi:vesicle coat complex subunit